MSAKRLQSAPVDSAVPIRGLQERVSIRDGFTLVELLVVISIIALLISILLPSLIKARHDALRIVCASNLRSLGQGCRIYADTYRGTEPPGSTQSPLGYGNWPFGNLAGWVNANPPAGDATAAYIPWGLGLLYTTKTITNPTLFYCPEGSYFTPTGAPQLYLGNLGQNPPNGGPANFGTVYLGYCYYYHLQVGMQSGHTVNPDLGGTVINPTSLQSQLAFASVPNGFAQSATSGDDTILASDLATSQNGLWQGFSNHFNGGNHDVTGGNVLYNDGHVIWKNASQMRCRLYNYTLDFWQ